MARLLLVDDDPDQVEIRKLVMEKNGHSVATAGNKPEALKSLDIAIPEVVVMDLRLPHTRDGLALIREMRQRSTAVAIIVVSGWPNDLRTQPEMEMVEHLLQKPVRTNKLLKLIDELA